MLSRSAVPTDLPASTAHRRGTRPERPGQAGRTASDRVRCEPLSVLAYAARCHAGQRRESDGAPFVEHLSEVARLLRDAGCADVVIAAGLLHSVLQETDVGAAELTARFGATVTALVRANTDECVGSYPRRKHALREQVHNADHDAAMLFAANEVSEVRELSAQVRRERARAGTGATPDRAARKRLERYRQMRLKEYEASLTMLLGVAPRHRLVRQLANELNGCPINAGHAPRVSTGAMTATATSSDRPERARLPSPSTSAAKTAPRLTQARLSHPGLGDREANGPDAS